MTGMKILVPVDHSKNSLKTINKLLAMQGKFSSPLTLLHVFDPDAISYKGVSVINFQAVREQGLKAAEEFLEEQKAVFAKAGMATDTLLKEGPARKIICDLANSGDYDLLVIGRHAEGEFRNLLFGYVSNYVIHKAKCPVIVL